MIVQLVVSTGNRAGQIIPVSVEKFVIGRADDCHLKASSELVSRYHCAILLGNDVIVRDLGSKNGVRLNGEKITTEQKLKSGDRLSVGPLVFYVNISADGEYTPDALTKTANSWREKPDDESSSFALYDTVLLDRLKSLNPERRDELEPPVTNLLKKFL